MSLDARTAQEQLTPEARRMMLRAFGDRMLLKLGNMDDPEDLPGIERAVRVAAVIERIYSRCDRAEGHAPDPNKLEAERARHMKDAIQARFELATSLEWNEKNQQRMGNWLDAAAEAVEVPRPAAPVAQSLAPAAPETVTNTSAAAPARSPNTSPPRGEGNRPASAAKAEGGGGLATGKPRQAASGSGGARADYAGIITAARRALDLAMSETERAGTPADEGGCDPPGRPGAS